MDNTLKISFEGSTGEPLAAKLDLPFGPIRAYAVFAHCFTCSKDLVAVRTISRALVAKGFAVFRFDFTGLGSSDGEFANTNFSSNIEDLKAAVDFVEKTYGPVEVLIGHSLGGAAVLSAGADLDNVVAVATIGAPSEASHVAHLFEESLDEINSTGEAEASIGGRKFKVKKQFLDNINAVSVQKCVNNLGSALLVLHSPVDKIVGIENAKVIFDSARHPKSFVSLNKADHLLSNTSDSNYVAEVISAWASQYVAEAKPESHEDNQVVKVVETGEGKFQNLMHKGNFHILADEPTSVGGLDSGPSPYDLLAMSLGACTSMTLRMYSNHKNLDFRKISVDVSHTRIHAKDCESCSQELKDSNAMVDQFERVISIENLPEELTKKVLEIADKCPVHKTLEAKANVLTTLE